MKCPHCLQSFHEAPLTVPLVYGGKTLVEQVPNKPHGQTSWEVTTQLCPACGRAIIHLVAHRWNVNVGNHAVTYQVYPKGTGRAPLSDEVPEIYRKDYREACTTLADSPKASAALSRRCLQNLLREAAKVGPTDLAKEIQEVLDTKTLPTHLAEAIDSVRNIGNFAAHPIKSTNTGEVLDVEPGEAEWLLDTLESLFDFYFVQPVLLKKKRDALNAKLAEAKKPPMK